MYHFGFAAFLASWWIASTGAPTLAAAQGPGCPALESRWNARYKNAFNIAWELYEFSCPGNTATLALTFFDLETPVFRPARNGYRPNFFGILTNHIKTLRFDPECDSLASANTRLGRVTLCPPFFKDTREDRASTLVHEARHLQADDADHVTCVGGSHKGSEGSCDEVFYEGQWKGSGYNADIFFYNWHLKNAESNELSRSVLQSHVNSMIPDRFNRISSEQVKRWRSN